MLTRLGAANKSKDEAKRLSTWTDDDLERFGTDGAWNLESGLSYDPARRIKDQDADGLSAEILYPSWGLFFFFLENVPLQAACLRAYNDWMAELCAFDPRRLYRYKKKFRAPGLAGLPSESFRGVYGRLVDEPIDPGTCRLFDGDNFMWGSDFPHSDSTWPHSNEALERNFATLPPDTARKI